MLSPTTDEEYLDDATPSPSPSSSQPMSSLEVEQPLPSVAELTGRASDDDERLPRRKGNNFVIAFLVLLVVVLLSLTIGLSVGLKQEEESKKEAVEAAHTQQTVEAVVDLEQRYDQVVRFLSDAAVSSRADLQRDGSPQQLAATFIAILDPLLLRIPHSHLVRDGYTFVTRYVLMVLYFATNGEEWTHKRHFKSELPTCQWWELNLNEDTKRLYDYTGVICNEKGIVTSLVLPDAKLEGTLPDELGLLFSVKSMVFNQNRLYGSIPTTFEQMINLQDLWLADNAMTGTLPAWIDKFVGLRSLDLSYNRMAGSLPVQLGNLQFVEMLALDNNLFSGSVQPIFNMQSNQYGGLKKVKFLYLEGNYFSGKIGDDFMYWDSSTTSPLVALDLSHNAFTGTLPRHIFSSFPALKVIDLNNNKLTGKLPNAILPNESLEFLALQGNLLSGEVSGLLPDLQKLTHLDVSSNQFDAWHIDLGAVGGLTYLFLADNPFPAGAFPTFLTSLTNLQELSLKSTQRKGTIPQFLADMTQLVLLDLDDNQFVGSIPPALGGLSNLEFLLLNRNQLTSSVPDQFRDLTSLRLLFLDGNDLTGNVDPICASRDPFVVADCQLGCSCCDKCCSSEEPCNDQDFIPTHDSAWQLGYERFQYWFGGAEGYEIMEKTP